MSETALKYSVLKNCYIANKTVYEPILCECLNKSKRMIDLVGGSFAHVVDQPSGQPDVEVIGEDYAIDFKMMIAESYKEFLSRSAPIRQEIAPGVIAYSSPPQLEKRVLLLWNCCRNMSEDRLQELRTQKRRDAEVKNVLHFFDNVVNCPKNILIFIPVCFEPIEETLTIDEKSKIIFEELSDTTQYIHDFRLKHQPAYATYLVYMERLSKEYTNFVISEFSESGLCFVDRVNMHSLDTIRQIENDQM